MQSSSPRTDFGQLLARGWMLFGKSLGATFPAAFLCDVLPLAAVITAIYYGFLSAFKPAAHVAQAMLRSLLENGFDEWAIGAAVEQVLSGMGDLTLIQMLLRMVGSLGGLAVVLLLLLPLILVCRLLLTPYGRGLSVQALSLHMQAQPVRMKDRYAAYKPVIGRMMALQLISLPPVLVLLALAALAAWLLLQIPTAGFVLALAAVLSALSCICTVRILMARIALDRSVPVLTAFSKAVKCFFTDWTYLAAGSLFFLGLLGTLVLIAVLDVLLMILVFLPPVLTFVTIAAALPLLQSLVTVLFEEQSARAQ